MSILSLSQDSGPFPESCSYHVLMPVQGRGWHIMVSFLFYIHRSLIAWINVKQSSLVNSWGVCKERFITNSLNSAACLCSSVHTKCVHFLTTRMQTPRQDGRSQSRLRWGWRHYTSGLTCPPLTGPHEIRTWMRRRISLFLLHRF